MAKPYKPIKKPKLGLRFELCTTYAAGELFDEELRRFCSTVSHTSPILSHCIVSLMTLDSNQNS